VTTINIDNKHIETFLSNQTKKNNITVVEYLNNLIIKEMELLAIKQDMKTIESEFKQLNQGKIKLKPARKVLDEIV